MKFKTPTGFHAGIQAQAVHQSSGILEEESRFLCKVQRAAAQRTISPFFKRAYTKHTLAPGCRSQKAKHTSTLRRGAWRAEKLRPLLWNQNSACGTQPRCTHNFLPEHCDSRGTGNRNRKECARTQVSVRLSSYSTKSPADAIGVPFECA